VINERTAVAIQGYAHTSVGTVAELLRTRAAEQPDRLGYSFLVDGDNDELRLTYAETDLRARRVAASLHAAGAMPGSRALLVLPPGLDYVTALFGCLYAGVVAVPVYPPDPFQLERSLGRLLAIVRDADPTVALTTAPLLGFLDEVTRLAPELGALRWVAVDADPDGDAAAEPTLVAPEATAVLQYTSGSTSDPRGVMLSHANLLHNSGLIQHLFGTTTESRGLVWLPPYHDMGLIGGLLQPLYGGFPITLMSPLHFLEQPMRWLRAIHRYGATASGGPNFAYDLCVRRADPDEVAQLDLSSWRVAFNGAEPIRPETLERFATTFAPAGFRADAFLPCYGLAEATLIVSGRREWRNDPAAELTGSTVPVDRAALGHHSVRPPGAGPVARLTSCGPAARDQRIEIVDPVTSVVCGPDRIGEIWVAGPSVAAGYWGKPSETERTFGAHLGDSGEGPFLRTGDLGFLHNGQLVVTGRLKDLIIVRGQNHYPQDIELTAERVDPILRPGCTAAFLPADDDDRLVLVHEIRRGSAAVDVADVAGRIRQAVAQQHGLDVSTVVLVRAGGLPKTSSGKIQRRLCRTRYLAGELPEVGRSEAPTGTAEVGVGGNADAAQVLAAPPGQRVAVLESYLRGLLLAMSGVEPTDRRQPLLALGLDSLAVIQLKHHVDRDLGASLPLAAMLAGASLVEVADDLADQLAAPDRAATGPSRTDERPGAQTAAAPMSFGQRWMWYLQSLEPASAAYTIAVALRLLDPIDGPAMQRALDAVVARHPALRTTFQLRDDELVQVVAPTGSATFRDHTAPHLDDNALRAVLKRVASTPFDLGAGPLLRVDLYRRPAGDVLLVSAHHIIVDFWSLTILAREVGAFYDAYASGRDLVLPQPATTYADAVVWQETTLSDPTVASRLEAYWDNQVGDALPRRALPPVGPGRGHSGAQHFALSTALAGQLRTQAAAANVTIYVLLLAAFQTLLHDYTGQDDLVVGAGMAGRTRPEVVDVVGCFTSPVIIRSRSTSGESFRSLLARTRDQVIGALEHQDYPMMMLARRQKTGRPGPLFDVLFTFNRSPRPADDLAALLALGPSGVRGALGSLGVERFPLPALASSLPVELVMAEVGGVPNGVLRYHADALDDATARDLIERFVAVLELVAVDPDRPIDQLVAVRQV
jgi:acyl-CoA synthetase (AMP-forming)/AMP-acid ligase II